MLIFYYFTLSKCLLQQKSSIDMPIELKFLHKQEKHRPRGSYVRKNSVLSAPSGARTLDTLIKSQVLYQLS